MRQCCIAPCYGNCTLSIRKKKLPYRKGIRYGAFSAVSEKSLVLENSCYDQLLHGKVPG